MIRLWLNYTKEWHLSIKYPTQELALREERLTGEQEIEFSDRKEEILRKKKKYSERRESKAKEKLFWIRSPYTLYKILHLFINKNKLKNSNQLCLGFLW